MNWFNQFRNQVEYIKELQDKIKALESELLTTKENSTKLVGELEAEVARLKDTPGGKLLYAAWNEIQELKAEIAELKRRLEKG